MAQVHNEIRKGWLSESVNRALGRTREGGVERVSETCDVVMNPWGMPEWAYLRGEVLCAYPRLSVAGAANQSAVALVNPASSRLIVVVEACSFQLGATGYGALWFHQDSDITAGLGSSSQGNRRDRRAGLLVSTAVVRYGNVVAVPTGSQLEVNYQTGGTAPFVSFNCLPVILAPGQALACWGTPVNTANYVNFVWRERLAYPGELV